MDDNQIAGVFYFNIGPDPTYHNIYEGAWINDEPYGVVHRIASGNRKKGVASFCLNWCLDKWPNIRIDTHRDNIVMQSFLNKMGRICLRRGNNIILPATSLLTSHHGRDIMRICIMRYFKNVALARKRIIIWI